MDKRKNPYSPGAGIQPPALVGRDQLLEDANIEMDRLLNGKPIRGMMLLGLRGVGKTVLLNRIQRDANAKGMLTAKIEAPEGGKLPELLIPDLRRMLYELDLIASSGEKVRRGMSALRNFGSAFKVSIGEIELGISPSPGVADTGNLEQDVPQLLISIAEAAKERNKTIVLFIDEVQYLSEKELAAIVVSCHEIAQRDLPFLFIGAGLPQIAALAGNAKSYSERLFNYPEVDKLSAEAASQALSLPADKENVFFEAEAIAEILKVTDRYPYFIQEWGAKVWDFAKQSPITQSDVMTTTPLVISHLDKNFFRVRFDRLTALQQKYLRAMAELGSSPYKTGDISAVLGMGRASQVSTIRQQLIDKGMIWSQRHGETAFTVPLFDEFMKRQIPGMELHVPKKRNKKFS